MKPLSYILLAAGVLSALPSGAPAQEATITIEANHVIHRISRYLTGACLEDVNHEVYGGLYSQMIFGESFQEPPPPPALRNFTAYDGWGNGVSGMWRPLRRGNATGGFSIESSNAFVGNQSQVMRFTGGDGEVGIENQGLNRWGMNFVAGNEYDGCVDVRADAPSSIQLSLESADGSAVYAQTNLLVTSNNWERMSFSLTPTGNDTKGRLAITLTQPGSVALGYVFLEPGMWGRFRGLPARKDVATGLIDQGITALRYGGSMVNAAGYRWKNMIGPRDRRPPYTGTWYSYSSDGWGIPDFLNFCEAAGFLGIPDFNINEAPQDMADFVQYANGSTNTEWGERRAVDGHPEPYALKYLELGNEERVDNTYYQKFQRLAKAIWAEDTNIIIVVGDFSYHQPITDPFHFSGADSGLTNLSGQEQILRLARQYNREVWFDLHVWTDGPTPDSSLAGMFSYDDALEKIAHGAKYKVVVFELNANKHSQRRALANALAINAAESDGRIPIMTSANCLQPDGENDNGWDQGLLFLNASQVWLQPPGYVTQMISSNHEPLLIESLAKTSGGELSVSAKRGEDGRTWVLDVVNPGPKVIPTTIIIHGELPTQRATVEELAGALNMTNSAGSPNQIHPLQKEWQPNFENGRARYDFQPYSFTALKFGN